MKLDYLATRQIQKLHDLKGDRNTRRVLAGMREYVSSFRAENGESVYHLSKSGRERVGSEVVRTKTTQAGHYLMRGDVYIRYRPEDWKNEMRFTVTDVVVVIPDAYFRHNMRRHFLEVDHLQHMSKNREKIDKYKKLKETGMLQQKLKYFPPLVWVTMTATRKKQLLEWCEGLDVVVHVWDDIR